MYPSAGLPSSTGQGYRYAALCPGETAALDCTDVRDGFIPVSRALDGRANEIKPPKSLAGIRSIPILVPPTPYDLR